MNRAMKLVMIAVAGGIVLGGCAAKEARWSRDSASLVVYAKTIPLYPGATFKDAMGSDTYGDTEDSHFEGMCLWFQVKGFDREKVLAWYEQRLPNAKTETMDSGTIQLSVPIANSEIGEDMGVWVDKDGFRIFEHTKPGKHKAS